MGIPRLTKHLLPFSEPTLLKGQNQSDSAEDNICVDSVVIDGPSLVYYVSSQLLSWTDSTIDILGVQPSCHEVSFGVMICLLHLTRLGIKM